MDTLTNMADIAYQGRWIIAGIAAFLLVAFIYDTPLHAQESK